MEHPGSIEELGTVTIDVRDAVQETLSEEPDFETVRDAYQEAIDKGWTARKASRLYFTKQRMGAVAETVFDPTSKTELMEGVYHRFLSRSPLMDLTKQNAEGEEQVIGRVKMNPGNGQQIVDGASADGTAAARNQLYTQVQGWVRRLLCRMMKNGCDPVEEAQAFCDRVMRMAQELADR